LFLPKADGVCGWNLTSPVSLLKSMQIVGRHILKNSTDPLTKTLADLSLLRDQQSNVRRWLPSVALERFESILSFNITFGGHSGRHGLGFVRKTNLRLGSLREKRKAITILVKEEESHSRLVSLHGLVRSGDFLKWDNAMADQLDWNNQILSMSSHECSFILNAQGLALPSPSNLRRWGLNYSARCSLCSKHSATAAHIFTGCTVALHQGRYTWRHDNVLRAIIKDLKGTVAKANRAPVTKSHIPSLHSTFVKGGVSSKKNPLGRSTSLLSQANDWVLLMDLDSLLVFPPCTGVVTSARPDIVIYSPSRRIVIWIELTVPIERRFVESAAKKTARYNQLKIDLSLKGWSVHPFTAEVGCIGFLSQTVRKFLKSLGFRGSHLKHTLSRMAQAARRSTFYIWNARRHLDWFAPKLYQQRFVREDSFSRSGALFSCQHTVSTMKEKQNDSSEEKSGNSLGTKQDSLSGNHKLDSNSEEVPCFFSDEGKHDTLQEEDNLDSLVTIGGGFSPEVPPPTLPNNCSVLNLPSSPAASDRSNCLFEDEFLAEEELMADGLLDVDDNLLDIHLSSFCDKFL
jgi:hypothetical protein